MEENKWIDYNKRCFQNYRSNEGKCDGPRFEGDKKYMQNEKGKLEIPGSRCVN